MPEDYLPIEEFIDSSKKTFGDYRHRVMYHHPDKIDVDDFIVPVDYGKFEDAIHRKFGDNTRVVITYNRVVQFEYDCGY